VTHKFLCIRHAALCRMAYRDALMLSGCKRSCAIIILRLIVTPFCCQCQSHSIPSQRNRRNIFPGWRGHHPNTHRIKALRGTKKSSHSPTQPLHRTIPTHDKTLQQHRQTIPYNSNTTTYPDLVRIPKVSDTPVEVAEGYSLEDAVQGAFQPANQTRSSMEEVLRQWNGTHPRRT
jgi:hypothetical protein